MVHGTEGWIRVADGRIHHLYGSEEDGRSESTPPRI
jgi:hypothetical protein